MRRPLLLLICAIVLALAAPVVAAAPPTAASGITVIESGASVDFPTGVVFRLKAESAAPIEKAELLFTKAGLETLNLVTAEVEPSERIDIELPVDFLLNFVPSGMDIKYHWRLTDADGAQAESDAEHVMWKDTRFDWERVKTDHVSVYSYAGNDAFAQAVLDSAQATVDRLMPVYGLKRLERVNVWLYNSKKDFTGSQAPNSETWIAGTAYLEFRLIFAVLPEGDMGELGRIIPHEISHQILAQATDNPFARVPAWLDEGLAVLSQESGFEDFPALVEGAAAEGRLLSIRALSADFPYDPAEATLAYAESYSIVRYIIDTYGDDRLSDLVRAYGDGLSDDEATTRALGVDLDQLDRDWKSAVGYQPPPVNA